MPAVARDKRFKPQTYRSCEHRPVLIRQQCGNGGPSRNNTSNCLAAPLLLAAENRILASRNIRTLVEPRRQITRVAVSAPAPGRLRRSRAPRSPPDGQQLCQL